MELAQYLYEVWMANVAFNPQPEWNDLPNADQLRWRDMAILVSQYNGPPTTE